jgi:hypothetical protein
MDFQKFKDGGRWNKEGKPELDKNRLHEGAIVEREHTSDYETAQRIAKDHLTESADYYKELKKMEKGFDKKAMFVPSVLDAFKKAVVGQ